MNHSCSHSVTRNVFSCQYFKLVSLRPVLSWELSQGYWPGTLILLHVGLSRRMLGFLTTWKQDSKSRYSNSEELEVSSFLRPRPRYWNMIILPYSIGKTECSGILGAGIQTLPHNGKDVREFVTIFDLLIIFKIIPLVNKKNIMLFRKDIYWCVCQNYQNFKCDKFVKLACFKLS